MLNFEDLTIVKNAAGLPTALGLPINSLFLKNNIFSQVGTAGGGGKKKKQAAAQSKEGVVAYENLGVPMGLVCTTETVCQRPTETQYLNVADEADIEIVPESLYNNLMDLLISGSPMKPQTKRRKMAQLKKAKKTRRNNKEF